MKRVFLIIAAVLLAQMMTVAQKPETAHPKAPETKSASIPLPAIEAQQLKGLQERANALRAEYEKQMGSLQAEFDKVVLRGAVKAKISIEQLDSSVVVLDDTGQYVWRQKEKEKPKP